MSITALSGCGPTPEEQAANDLREAAENMEDAVGEGAEGLADAMGAFGDAMNRAGADGENYEPVERQALAGVIPESMADMERTSIESARDGVMGMTVTHAEAEFNGENGSFTLKVTDLAGLPMGGFMGAAWAMADIDRESGTEIERTFMYNGNRAYEKYNSASNSGEMSVIVDGFLLEGRGRNMSREQIQETMGDAPIRELGGLR